MPLSVGDLVRKWKINSLSEVQGSHAHFIDLCVMLGVPNPAENDPSGERYCFNRHLSKVYGGRGFADVWKRGFFAWEYKGKHKDLKAAYRQLNDYREDLGNPPLLVVCDLDRIEIHLFAKLAERLEIEHRLTASKEQIAHFLMRVLFCLFADSIGLLPRTSFAASSTPTTAFCLADFSAS